MLRTTALVFVPALSLAACCTSAAATDVSPSADPAPRVAQRTAAPASPAPETSGAAAAEARVAPMPGLTIVEGHGGIEDGTMLILCGEVKNGTAKTIIDVRVAVRLFDAKGKELTVTSILTEVAKDLGQSPVESVNTDRQIVPPGETAPFCYFRSVEKIHGVVASHALTIHTARALDVPPVMRLSGFKSKWDPIGYWDVTARVENAGRTNCRSPAIALAVYDAAGKVVRVQEANSDAYFQKQLAPGQGTDIEVRAISAEKHGVRVQGWADCSSLEL